MIAVVFVIVIFVLIVVLIVFLIVVIGTIFGITMTYYTSVGPCFILLCQQNSEFVDVAMFVNCECMHEETMFHTYVIISKVLSSSGPHACRIVVV